MSNTNVVRTAMAGRIQTSQHLGKGVPALPHSTLNQKLGIHQDVDMASGEMQVTRYLAIGNGGHNFIVGANGRVKWRAVHHKARHAALYNQLPFVLRPIANDLSADQRARYRLRRIEQHNGEQYVAYYLRVLDLSNSPVEMEIRNTENGITTSTPYVPTLEDLNPQPPALVTGQAITTTGEYIATTCKVPFVMTPDDVQEFIDACRIIEGEDGYAVISEMATVAAVDRNVSGLFNGVTKTYVDAIRAQVTSFISTAFVMDSLTDGIQLTVDIGNVEPMLNTTPV